MKTITKDVYLYARMADYDIKPELVVFGSNMACMDEFVCLSKKTITFEVADDFNEDISACFVKRLTAKFKNEAANKLEEFENTIQSLKAPPAPSEES